MASFLAIVLIWTANLLEIISLASRAFALYYFLQCAVALMASDHYYGRGVFRLHRIYFGAVATILVFVVVFAIPAE